MSAGGEIELEDARRAIAGALAPLPAVGRQLDASLGRVLREDVVAEQPLPGFDSSAMDGFAVRARDLARAGELAPVELRLVGEARAGHPGWARVGRGEAVAISTGAMVPGGADAVVRLERTSSTNGCVRVHAAVAAGAEIRRAGEDVAAGTLTLRAGTRLGPAEIGMLAALGRARVRSSLAPRVSILVTGDELVSGQQPLRPGAVRDSNSHALRALARCAGALVLRTLGVPDDPAQTTAAIARAASDCDVVVVCGGVSVGRHDHVRASLRALGARERFWGLALKPGHPAWFGTLGRAAVFGLPGNPVSAMVTFTLLVEPALAALEGELPRAGRTTAALAAPYSKPAGRAHALRCRLEPGEEGWRAVLTGPQGSHVLSSMLAADALAIVPGAATELPAGARVEIEPLRRGGLGAFAS